MTGPEPCPRCGSTPTPGSPGGLCPRCRFQGVLDKGSAPETTGGVLDTLSVTGGPMPRVLLRDSEDFNGPGPIVRPTSDEMPDRAGRLQLFGEIARGGMGAVLKGRDNDLGRDLAIKVVEEAQIAGQLQHPGVVPVYELGTFADRRPYFAMKLVKGRTLAEVMAERAHPSDDHPRLLAIFLDVAQTMAYSHARGVIHRDLKPSNVMVGSFGEVQVMDWGLAKVLPRGGVVDDPCAASLAADGQGKDDPPPDEVARAKLREQALGWLKAELAAWTKLLESDPHQARPVIAQTLKHWKVDTDLAGIRDADALAKLPEVERKDWQALWAEVDALLARAGAGKPK